MVVLKLDLDADYVLSALLRHNYFPAHKADLSELPPVFTTSALSDQVASDLAASGGRGQNCGYDSVVYLSTRFNNVPRPLSVPHPVPHSRLSLCIHENWDELKLIRSNPNSFLRPRVYPDGRLFTMEYETGAKRATRVLRQSFGKRFLVNTDIARCYPSIYTHSIPWAAVGKQAAKMRRGRDKWFNIFDKRVREANRGETHGIVIGPATSSIVAEFILGRVDEALRGDFTHFRFVDDFSAYCDSEEEALEFVRRLSDALRGFNLGLNARKTAIHGLPRTNSADWLHQLSLWAPKKETLGVYDVVNYLDLALSMANREPDSSVLKYAIKVIRGRAKTDEAMFAQISYTLNLAYHNPVLVPLLDTMFREMQSKDLPLNYSESILGLADKFARTRCADGLSWGLFYAAQQGVAVEDALANEVLSCADCFTLTQLYRTGSADVRGKVVDFAKAIVGGVSDEIDKYELDQYWLLLYEMFRDGEIANPYANEDAFDIMMDAGVTFLA